jgi:hypothetical protein
VETASFVAAAGTGVGETVGDVPGVLVDSVVGVPAHPTIKRREEMIAIQRRSILER